MEDSLEEAGAAPGQRICETSPTPHGMCDNVAKVTIDTALKRWGAETHLDQIQHGAAGAALHSRESARPTPGRRGKRERHL